MNTVGRGSVHSLSLKLFRACPMLQFKVCLYCFRPPIAVQRTCIKVNTAGWLLVISTKPYRWLIESATAPLYYLLVCWATSQSFKFTGMDQSWAFLWGAFSDEHPSFWVQVKQSRVPSALHPEVQPGHNMGTGSRMSFTGWDLLGWFPKSMLCWQPWVGSFCLLLASLTTPGSLPPHIYVVVGSTYIYMYIWFVLNSIRIKEKKSLSLKWEKKLGQPKKTHKAGIPTSHPQCCKPTGLNCSVPRTEQPHLLSAI